MADSIELHGTPAELYQTLLATTDDMIVMTDADLSSVGGPRILYVNAAFERVVDGPAREFVGQRLSRIYASARLADLLDRMRAAGETREEIEFELQSGKPDAKRIWSVRIVPMPGHDGKLAFYACMGRDITARRRAELERDTAQRLLASIFTVVEQGIALVDHTGRIAMGNSAFSRRLGVRIADFLGRPLAKWLPQDAADAFEQLRTRTAPRPGSAVLHMKPAVGAAITARALPLAVNTREAEHVYTLVSLASDGADDMEAGRNFGQGVRDAASRSTARPATVVAGKLQLIGLDEVREALGARWRATADHVFGLAESVLRRSLGPRDTWRRTQDDGFLVCFADLSEAEAAFKSSVIRDEIRERLIGDSDFADTKVSSYVAEIQAPPDDPETEEVDLASAIELRLQADRQQREAALRHTLRREVTHASIRLVRARSAGGDPARLLIARLPEALEASLEAFCPDGLSDLSLDAEMLLLSAVAERVLRGEVTMSDLVLVAVNAETLLQRRARENWLKVAHSTGTSGKTRMIVEIVNVPKSVSHTRVAEITVYCASLFRAVAIELADCDPSVLTAMPLSARILTVPVYRACHATAAFPAFVRLARGAAIRARQLLVKGVASPQQEHLLAEMGGVLVAEP